MAIPDKELDYHYSPSRWSHRYGPDEVIQAHIKSVTEGSKHAQWILDCEAEVQYGFGHKQKLDIYNLKGASRKGLPVLVYIHGGYWQDLGREMSGFPAVPVCKAGATLIAVGYDLAPEVTMDKIVSEIKQALRFIIRYAKDNASKGIYLLGHSAGAHLAAMMLACEFMEDDAFDSELIKGAFLVSGVYDLRPITKTYVNIPLRMTEDDAWRFSPANFVAEIGRMSRHRDILIAVAEYDAPEFRRQSGELEKELRQQKLSVRYMDLPDTDHFDVVEKLQKENYRLTGEIIRLMGLQQ